MSINVLVIDDHEVTREGLSHLFRGTDLKMTGEASSGAAGLELISKNTYDVVLIDIRLPDMDGLALLEEIRSKHGTLPVVMISTFDNPTYVARAVAIGANDYLLKSDSKELIIDVLQRAATKQEASPRSMLRRIRNTMDLPGTETGGVDLPLTGREVQVLRHMALGLSNKEIARSLTISVETVKEHIQNILRKLNAADRTDAAVRAVKQGLLVGV